MTAAQLSDLRYLEATLATMTPDVREKAMLSVRRAVKVASTPLPAARGFLADVASAIKVNATELRTVDRSLMANALRNKNRGRYVRPMSKEEVLKLILALMVAKKATHAGEELREWLEFRARSGVNILQATLALAQSEATWPDDGSLVAVCVDPYRMTWRVGQVMGRGICPPQYDKPGGMVKTSNLTFNGLKAVMAIWQAYVESHPNRTVI